MNRLPFKSKNLFETLFVLLISLGTSQAQFVEYSQFQMSPSSLNPALTGIAHGPESPFSIATNGHNLMGEPTGALQAIIWITPSMSNP